MSSQVKIIYRWPLGQPGWEGLVYEGGLIAAYHPDHGPDPNYIGREDLKEALRRLLAERAKGGEGAG